MRKKKRGQSTLEYLLLISALTVVAIYAAQSIIAPRSKTLVDTAGSILNTSDEMLNASVSK